MKMLRKKLAHVLFSIRALYWLWHEEYSFRILALCGIATGMLSALLHISRTEWMVVLLTIGAMLSIETLNTAIEELCDHVAPEEHAHIGQIKDLGSAAALLMWCAALIVGLIVFVPHLFV